MLYPYYTVTVDTVLELSHAHLPKGPTVWGKGQQPEAFPELRVRHCAGSQLMPDSG